MSKVLNIKSSRAALHVSNISKNVNINNRSLNELIYKNLPEELEEYKEYPVELELTIKFLNEDVRINTEGYEIKEEEEDE